MPEPIAETQRTYDVIAATYAQVNSTVHPQLAADAAVLTSGLAPGAVVVDVGCGPGREVGLLRSLGFRAFGIDRSLGQLAAGGLGGVLRGDMRWLPLRTACVDALWCQAALLHIPRSEVPAVLGEFGRVVRPGGRLYLSVAEGDGEGFEVASNYGSSERRWFTNHREPELTRQLAGVGFVVEQVSRASSYRDWLSLHARRVLADGEQG
ncbi:class I SAM-dependent methyltransferase [Flindersiella endophytica]